VTCVTEITERRNPYRDATPLTTHASETLSRPTSLLTLHAFWVACQVAFPPVMILHHKLLHINNIANLMKAVHMTKQVGKLTHPCIQFSAISNKFMVFLPSVALHPSRSSSPLLTSEYFDEDVRSFSICSLLLPRYALPFILPSIMSLSRRKLGKHWV